MLSHIHIEYMRATIDVTEFEKHYLPHTQQQDTFSPLSHSYTH